MENLFKKQQEEELAAKRAEKERIEKERLASIKQKEVQRITEERRRNEKANSESPNSSIPLQQSLSHDSIPVGSNTSGSSPVQKSSSIVNLFGDRLRRGSDSNVKRAESMKIGPKTPKRTPSFTTRRRVQSFRKNQQADQFDLPPVAIQGMLERKHELQSGGKKAPVRSWKAYYTVLCGQLLCFFKDTDDFYQKKASTAPVNILNARCFKADDYTKKKHVFRLHLPDGSEFLFLANSEEECLDWVNKISFHASLPPNLQLTPYQVSGNLNPNPSQNLNWQFFIFAYLIYFPFPVFQANSH